MISGALRRFSGRSFIGRFKPRRIGDLVSKGAASQFVFRLQLMERNFATASGRTLRKVISSVENHVPPRASNSIFLPAKEVLSLLNIILKSRETDKVFGFDDTYLDLARALRQSSKRAGTTRSSPSRNRTWKRFSAAKSKMWTGRESGLSERGNIASRSV